FVKDARKIVPSLKTDDIYYAKNFGGVRPQVLDKKAGELMLGEASITEIPGIIFNMTPSPGATSCLGNGYRDAKLICQYLGANFNEDLFTSELL
ncbi:malate:quinone oxidoreductase, partial [Campylobacter lari]|nr:malate:quinone oxidoreductase [Campylobacter lari]